MTFRNKYKFNNQNLQMKKIFLTIAIFSTVNNLAFSQEEKQDTVNKKDYTVAVHFHPWTLFISALSMRHPDNPMKYYYLTIEKPLNLHSSLIIKPSLVSLNDLGIITGHPGKGGIKIGSDFGVRYFPNKKGEGFYIQPQVGVFNINPYYPSSSFVGADIMGYLGFSQKGHKVSMFFDIGLGFGNNPFFINNSEISEIFDINVGLGFKFR